MCRIPREPPSFPSAHDIVQEGGNHCNDIFPEEKQNCAQRTQLHDGDELRPGLRMACVDETKDLSAESEVSGAADREEFRDTLDDSEENGNEDVQEQARIMAAIASKPNIRDFVLKDNRFPGSEEPGCQDLSKNDLCNH
jgi:hypothetical protein